MGAQTCVYFLIHLKKIFFLLWFSQLLYGDKCVVGKLNFLISYFVKAFSLIWLVQELSTLGMLSEYWWDISNHGGKIKEVRILTSSHLASYLWTINKLTFTNFSFQIHIFDCHALQTTHIVIRISQLQHK